MSKQDTTSTKMLRFRRSERHLHWALAIPFMICYFSALTLVIDYNPDPTRPYREIISWVHRISGICLFVFPVIALLINRHDIRIYFYNVKQACSWNLQDVKFLFLMVIAPIFKKISLPDQGKFNAAEKINFMTLMGTYPVYIVTGALLWITDGAILAFFIHFGAALIATPLMFGHIYMATLNPETRVAFSGMINGYVDRHFVQHHHAQWHKDNYHGTVPIHAEDAITTEYEEDKEKADKKSSEENLNVLKPAC